MQIWQRASKFLVKYKMRQQRRQTRRRPQRGCTGIALCNRTANLRNWQKFSATACTRQISCTTLRCQNEFLGPVCPGMAIVAVHRCPGRAAPARRPVSGVTAQGGLLSPVLLDVRVAGWGPVRQGGLAWLTLRSARLPVAGGIPARGCLSSSGAGCGPGGWWPAGQSPLPC